MGIRIRHDGAGVGASGGGASGGGSSQRKYGQALVMQQQEANRRMQERQQDAMLAYGRERRGVVDDWNRRAEEDVRARQRFQIANDARAAENQMMLDARREDRDADHTNRMEILGKGQDFQQRMKDREIANSEKQRRDETALAAAMAKGEIEQAIADGEFDEATARKLQQTFIDELAITDDDYPDEIQREVALAQLRARRLRIAQNRKAVAADAPSPPASAIEAFNQNQDVEDRFMALAREEFGSKTDMKGPPVYDQLFKRAEEIYNKRYGIGGGEAGRSGARGSQPAPTGGAQNTPQAGGAGKGQASAFNNMDNTALAEVLTGGVTWKDKAREDQLSTDYFAKDIEFGKNMDDGKFVKNENLTRAINSLSPEMRRAYRIAHTNTRELEASDEAKQAAAEMLKRAGIDPDLIKQIPAAKTPDWSGLGSSSGVRSGLGRLYAESREADPDIQNAIAILVNPRENAKDREKAMEHLKKRNFDVMSIIGY